MTAQHDYDEAPDDEPAIARLVAHNGGPVALCKKLGGYPVYQEISRWLARGWASPHHLFRLEPFMPRGMKVRDLAADRERARGGVTPAR
jgi:hypothetical protein